MTTIKINPFWLFANIITRQLINTSIPKLFLVLLDPCLRVVYYLQLHGSLVNQLVVRSFQVYVQQHPGFLPRRDGYKMGIDHILIGEARFDSDCLCLNFQSYWFRSKRCNKGQLDTFHHLAQVHQCLPYIRTVYINA